MLLKSLSSYSKFTITEQTVSIPMKFMVQLARNRIVRVCFIDVKYGIVPYITIRVTVSYIEFVNVIKNGLMGGRTWGLKGYVLLASNRVWQLKASTTPGSGTVKGERLVVV